MRVLVTGATGFVGNAVTAALARHGHEPVALVRGDRPVPSGAVAAVRGDVLDVESMRVAVADVDGVCHLAARTRVRDSFTDPVGYWRANVGGTLNVLEALTDQAGRSGPRSLVLASTAGVYGTPERQPITEEAPTLPQNPYGSSKLAADQAAADVAATGALGAISLRSFNIAGAATGVTDTDLTRLIPKLLAVHAGHEPELVINGDGSAVRDFVHVLDMAEAFALAIDACISGQWRAYSVGSGQRTRVLDVLHATEQITGRQVRIAHRPPATEPPVLIADHTRISHDLGWAPRNSDLPTI
ncbi:MAG: NAD-dependent epimerase/dehydratase family protein, partial [Pseudonocardiales bacterium]